MQKLDNLLEIDRQLIDMASAELRDKNTEPLQTVIAAARMKSGNIHSAINLYHFTGGPCAEGVLMAGALFEDDLFETIVAVHYDNNGTTEIINPCGRCRQMFNDYTPDVSVIVGHDGWATKVSVAELLPYAYRNNATEYHRVVEEDS